MFQNYEKPLQKLQHRNKNVLRIAKISPWGWINHFKFVKNKSTKYKTIQPKKRVQWKGENDSEIAKFFIKCQKSDN